MVIYNVLQLLNEKGNPPSEFKILRSFRIKNQPVKFKKKNLRQILSRTKISVQILF